MNATTELLRHDAARLLIDAAGKILDMQHGAGYAAMYPDKVDEFIESVVLGIWVKQMENLAASLDITP